MIEQSRAETFSNAKLNEISNLCLWSHRYSGRHCYLQMPCFTFLSPYLRGQRPLKKTILVPTSIPSQEICMYCNRLFWVLCCLQPWKSSLSNSDIKKKNFFQKIKMKNPAGFSHKIGRERAFLGNSGCIVALLQEILHFLPLPPPPSPSHTHTPASFGSWELRRDIWAISKWEYTFNNVYLVR